MNINPTPKVREVLYLLTVFINAFVAIAVTQVTLSIWVLASVGGLNALVAAMAKSNVSQ